MTLTPFGAAYSLLANREESPRSLLKGDVAYGSREYLWRKPPGFGVEDVERDGPGRAAQPYG